jgi:hypothetical protein
MAPKLQQKVDHEIKKEEGILQNVCVKFVRFIKDGENHSVQEIGELIHGLQKSVLSLQRKRQKLMWRKDRKKD